MSRGGALGNPRRAAGRGKGKSTATPAQRLDPLEFQVAQLAEELLLSETARKKLERRVRALEKCRQETGIPGEYQVLLRPGGTLAADRAALDRQFERLNAYQADLAASARASSNFSASCAQARPVERNSEVAEAQLKLLGIDAESLRASRWYRLPIRALQRFIQDLRGRSRTSASNPHTPQGSDQSDAG